MESLLGCRASLVVPCPAPVAAALSGGATEEERLRE